MDDRSRFDKLVELTRRYPELGDDQLTDVEELLVAELAQAADDRDVGRARSVGELVDKTRGEQRRRRVRAEEDAKELEALLVKAGLSEQEDEPEPEVEAPAAVVASLKTGPVPSIADLARKRRRQTPIREPVANQPRFTSSYGGHKLVGLSEVGEELLARLRSPNVSGGRVTVASSSWELPVERRLNDDWNENTARIEAALAPPALLASGGICAPPESYYAQQVYAVGDRPIRDSLPLFSADRGGIRYILPPVIGDISSGVDHITEAEDAAGATKSCLEVACGDVEEVLVSAVYRCLRFGNFDARVHGERVEAFVSAAIAAQARLAERNLWQSMCSASTAVTASEGLGAWRDLYEIVTRAAAAIRSRQRMRSDQVLRLLAPAWLGDLLAVDLVRQAPGDNTVAGVSRAQFETALRTVGIAVSWTLEGSVSTPQIFGTQTAGPLNAWPTSAELLLFSEGTWLYLDGGILDLGIVRDSTLNLSNQLEVFAETFENVAYLGPESLCLTLDICASGLSAGFDDTIACAS